jgi:hypothetical protein
MTYEQLINHYKSAANVARAFGVTTASVAGWKRKGVPPIRQFQIELDTNGALLAQRIRKNTTGAS